MGCWLLSWRPPARATWILLLWLGKLRQEAALPSHPLLCGGAALFSPSLFPKHALALALTVVRLNILCAAAENKSEGAAGSGQGPWGPPDPGVPRAPAGHGERDPTRCSRARGGTGTGPWGSRSRMGPRALGAPRLGMMLLVLGHLPLPPVWAPSESKCLGRGRPGAAWGALARGSFGAGAAW